MSAQGPTWSRVLKRARAPSTERSHMRRLTGPDSHGCLTEPIDSKNTHAHTARPGVHATPSRAL